MIESCEPRDGGIDSSVLGHCSRLCADQHTYLSCSCSSLPPVSRATHQAQHTRMMNTRNRCGRQDASSGLGQCSVSQSIDRSINRPSHPYTVRLIGQSIKQAIKNARNDSKKHPSSHSSKQLFEQSSDRPINQLIDSYIDRSIS